jgi:hypothetical protein
MTSETRKVMRRVASGLPAEVLIVALGNGAFSHTCGSITGAAKCNLKSKTRRVIPIASCPHPTGIALADVQGGAIGSRGMVIRGE